MGSIKIAGKNVVTQSGSDEPTIASNVVFPSGQVLQTQYDSYSTQTTIGDTNTYILTSTFSTRGTNSRILVLTNLLYGASGDALGFNGGITMTSGSSASTDYDGDAIQLGATTEGTTGKLFQDDIGNGRLNGCESSMVC